MNIDVSCGPMPKVSKTKTFLWRVAITITIALLTYAFFTNTGVYANFKGKQVPSEYANTDTLRQK